MTYRVTIAQVARHFGVPAGRVRKWIFDDKVHRMPDGSINVNCLGVYLMRDTLTDALADHDLVCNTSVRPRVSNTRVTARGNSQGKKAEILSGR